jgi:hypothetical protein
LRCLLELVEGTLLLRSRLNHLFDSLHWQIDEAARLLTAQGGHISGGTSTLGRTIDRVELPPLFIAQRPVKPLKRRTQNVHGFDGRIQSLLGGIEAANRSDRSRRWTGLDDIAC